MTGHRPLRVAMVVGEESGDQLGARLMAALRRLSDRPIEFFGVGGDRMAAEGLVSLFPLHDIAVMGFGPVVKRLPLIQLRTAETAGAVIAGRPDVLVIVDSPDFTHRVARDVRAALPGLPVVDYVCPSVWAWRPNRARRMAAYIDHVLTLLPFEPAVLARLKGPEATYVGHPLIDRPELLTPAPGERPPIGGAEPPTLLVLPGSRSGEIDRMLALYGRVLDALSARGLAFRPVLPAVDRLRERIERETAGWAARPRIVTGEAEKWAAFRTAHAALATSGTVTLELALAGVPSVIAYARDPLFRLVSEIARRIPGLVNITMFGLANIILGDKASPEFLDPDLAPERLADALAPLLADTPARAAQLAAFSRLRQMMALPDGRPAAETAAEVVLRLAGR
ncbi:Lipid-A-disaccharide synthase [uncultured Pleomorphomonas sp.]|uniref:Lipid-A-disaccharide synthase n=1 Tax=uncultured Pleomorphomonas sp. TaxID=442121 RepID=A0A212LGA9_9HYPH|nr:lipid-A-disaccharide synthase [uncultured Pleomorphomonas sp.]SCM76594.1 Lipid-A-disaccharide synthase [uncultured Pleomorphomonas sp.]